MSILEQRPRTAVDRRLEERLLEAADAAEGFSGPEHRDIGDLASKHESTSIVYGTEGKRLTFGEVVALAGDYFGTYQEMRDCSRSQNGRTQLAWARWRGLELPPAEEPRVDEQARRAVVERYFFLAGRNVSHFSAGGTAWSEYVRWHAAALPDAFEAGERRSTEAWRRALTKEAFGQHFLTDMFSAGHVRTPRASIQSWYAKSVPSSGPRLLRYMANFMYEQLEKGGRLPLLARLMDDTVKSFIRARIETLGGEAVRSFTFGDIVGLALHNYENEHGLRVRSDVDKSGKVVPNGHPWTAMGDAHLGKSNAGAETKAMAVAAGITSIRDLQRVRDLGRRTAGRSVSLAARTVEIRRALGASSPTFVFAAKAFVPREDRTPGANVPYPSGGSATSPLDWRWGRLGSITYRAVETVVKKDIADELLKKASDIRDPATGYGLRVHGTRRAFRAFCAHLKSDGIKALERAIGRKAR